MVLDRWRPSRGLIPWQPFRAMEEMEHRFDEMFGRGFLPSTVDATKIEANCEDGILEVSLPKASEVKPKKIVISAKKREKVSK